MEILTVNRASHYQEVAVSVELQSEEIEAIARGLGEPFFREVEDEAVMEAAVRLRAVFEVLMKLLPFMTLSDGESKKSSSSPCPDAAYDEYLRNLAPKKRGEEEEAGKDGKF